MNATVTELGCQDLHLHGFILGRTGLVPDGEPAFDDWQTLVQWLQHRADGAIHWWIGDALNHGEQCWGSKYTEAMVATGYDYGTLRDDKWVAGQIDLSRRRDKLSWSHHKEVASLDSDQQDELLAEAEREGLTLRELRERVRQQKVIAATEQAGPVPTGRYRCIVIDPPWPLEKIVRADFPNQHRDLDYPVMSLAEIESCIGGHIHEVAAENCHIYMWVTHKFLPEGLRLFQTWGVRYECLLTWVKPAGMTPYSWMYNTEHVLFGRLGSLKLNTLGLKLAFDAPAVGHSVKPDVFFERVAQASPGPRLEMFARRPREGFVTWGNEVPRQPCKESR